MSRTFQTQGKTPARAQNAMDLGERGLSIEPMERLGDGHGVRRAVGQRNVLGRPLDCADRRLDQRPHSRQWLNRDHLRAGGAEGSAQLARPGGEVDDAWARCERQPISQPVDRLPG